MNVTEYRNIIHEDLALASNVNMTNIEEEFLNYVAKSLIDGEEFDDFIECYYQGLSRRKANMRIDGYAADDSDGSMCIFISDYRGPFENDSIRSEEINLLFKKIRYFVEEAINQKLFKELEESTQVYEFAKLLHDENEIISKYRFYLITDAYNKQRTKNIKDTEIYGKTVELNVWDITRIYDLVSSKSQKESVEIVLAELGYDGIPCVKAVEYHSVTADIEVVPKFEEIKSDFMDDNKLLDLVEESNTPDNVIAYSSYLAAVPGVILKDLYLEYGSRLLEGNVRSFLSVRGKVNKSIQNTIKNYPEMFFAYNNGIAATATNIETKMTDDGLKIIKMNNLQIVNGGQTTASIANTILTAKKDENVDISKLYVPMKVSVLEQSMSEKIIPKISEYSNSQNKVDASDFFSNHPFHIRMEEYSRKTPAPAIKGNQYQQYWYYERTRGQYNQAKMKFKPKSSQMKQFETKYPENQVIKMVDLAKYMEIYEGGPDKVSKGKQAIVNVFSNKIKGKWAKNQTEFNNFYFKRVVSIAIIFKCTDDIVKNSEWYKIKRSYKANVVAYTMSILFDYIKRRKKGYELDFIRIWDTQEIYKELREQIQILSKEVYEFITRSDRLTENVTEWCKKEKCWERAQNSDWTITDSFIGTLISIDFIKTEEKQAKDERKVANEIDDLKFIFSFGKGYWQKMLEWGLSRKLLSDMEISIIKMVINMDITNRIPSKKQAIVVKKAREKLIEDGMPLQF